MTKDERLVVLSLGAGVQSSTMALMAAKKVYADQERWGTNVKGCVAFENKEVNMAIKSQAQWDRLERLVKDGTITKEEFDKAVKETGCEKCKLPERLGKKREVKA